MIKRKIVLYAALFAIIIGGAPYFTGYLVETKFQDVIKVASEFDPVTITLLEYQRGWRKSYAKTRLTFKGKYLRKVVHSLEAENPTKSPLQSPQLSIILEHEIRHGPFVQLKDGNYREWLFALAALHSKLFLTEENKKILVSELGDTELLTLQGQITIEGAVHLTIAGKALKLKETAKEHVFWKGVRGQWHLSRDMKHLQGEVVMPGFDFDWENLHYYADDLTFKTERFKTPESLWLGKGTLSVQKLGVRDSENASRLILSGLVAGGVMDTEGGMIDSSATLRVEQLKYLGKQYGPMHYALTLKNVESRVAKGFVEIIHKMQLAEQNQQQVYLKEMLALVPDLLKTRPEFNLEDMSVHTEQGDVKGFLNFAIGGPQASDVNHLTQIVQSMAANAQLTFPKVFLHDFLTHHYMTRAVSVNLLQKEKKTSQQITEQVQQEVEANISKQLIEGTLTERDNNYAVEIQFQQGKLMMNGKIVELPPASTALLSLVNRPT